MTTKPPSKKDVTLILAEDVRPEAAGKFTLLGFIPGNTIAISGSPPQGIPGLAFMIPSLAIVLVISNGEGKFDGGRLTLTAPDKKTLIGQLQLQVIEMRPAQPTVIANALKPFAGPEFGAYQLQLEIGKTKFKFPLNIVKAPEIKAKRT